MAIMLEVFYGYYVRSALWFNVMSGLWLLC